MLGFMEVILCIAVAGLLHLVRSSGAAALLVITIQDRYINSCNAVCRLSVSLSPAQTSVCLVPSLVGAQARWMCISWVVLAACIGGQLVLSSCCGLLHPCLREVLAN
jgi:hypothetical protein